MAKKDEGQRDRSKAAERMQARREEDARIEDKDGFAVRDPRRGDRPSHPDGWQTGGRDENG